MTTMRAFFQSNSLARVAIVTRVALSVHRGACLRSTKKISCFRRKRFSAVEGAARAAQVVSERDGVQNNRPDIRKTVARASLSTFLRRRWRVVGSTGTKQSVTADLNRVINAGSTFCGAQLYLRERVLRLHGIECLADRLVELLESLGKDLPR